MRALSIRQPWAWLIVHGFKPVENRDWATKYRGEFLVHAGKTMTRKYYDQVIADLQALFGDDAPPVPDFEQLDRGGVVGVSRIVDCVARHDSPYFFGPYGFVLADSRPLPFHPCNGALSFFDVPGFRP